MRLVLLGAPGSGKGTQAKLLTQTHHVPQISTGDLLRAAVEADSPLGQQARVAMEAGRLVSDELVLAMIEERLAGEDTGNGFILDGFPRNTAQAQALDLLLERMGQPLDLALLIDVDTDALMQRLTGRRTCESCGQTYNVYTSPPRIEDRCDRCGGNLRHRADDREETIGNRLRIYEAQTMPVIEYYRHQGRLKVVQGVGEVPQIQAAIEKVIEEVREEVQRRMGTEPAVTSPSGPAARAGSKSRKATIAAIAASLPRSVAPSQAGTEKGANPKEAEASTKATPKKADPKKAPRRKKP